jgi:hypothetical protein
VSGRRQASLQLTTIAKGWEFPSSVVCQRTGQDCSVRERPQSLETSVADGPDVDEGYVDRDASLSRRSFDPADRDDMPAPRDELFGGEMNVKSSIEAGKEALEYVLETLEVAGSDGHAFRHVVNDMWRLESAQSRPMPRGGRFVERSNQFLVVLDHSSPRLAPSRASANPGHETDLVVDENQRGVFRA